MRFGSPIAQAAQPFNFGQVDLLFNGSSGSSGGPATLAQFITAKNIYNCIAIFNAGAIANAVAILVNNNTSLVPLGSSCCIPRQPDGNDIIYLPIQCNAGDILNLQIQVNAATAGHNIQVVGLTNGPVIPQRFDGRLHPLGVYSAQGTNIAGSTLIAAPGGGLRILLKQSFNLVVATNVANVAAFISIVATIAGSPVWIAGAAATGQSAIGAGPSDIPEDGLLLDTNTAVTYTTGGAGVSAVVANAVYDLVFT